MSTMNNGPESRNRIYAGEPIYLPYQVLLTGLPKDATETLVKATVSWSKSVVKVEVLPHESSRDGPFHASALVTFNSHDAAKEAKLMLHMKENCAGTGKMQISWYYPGGRASAQSDSESDLSAQSSGDATPQGHSYYHPRDKVSPIAGGNGYVGHDFPKPDGNHAYSAMFSPQSPIGNHLNDRIRISGKAMINNDSADDDETGELIRDPISYAENGLTRRSTVPKLPISRLSNLSLTTSNVQPSQIHVYSTPQQQGLGYGGPLSPMGNGGPPANYQLTSQHYSRHSFPPVNPADQNPPCNTLYVGNLPIDTNEDELKAMFSKQRGYKRLCFRTKANGPMCFVEFEDVSFATKALHELYGHPLHNSVKGGIRLSFSKNPLGVRSGQGIGAQQQTAPNGMMMYGGMNGMMNGGYGSSFATANGPPPGLAAPPGLGNNRPYNGMMMAHTNGNAGPYQASNYASNGWMNQPNYPRMVTAGGHPTMNGHPGFPPAYMMGR